MLWQEIVKKHRLLTDQIDEQELAVILKYLEQQLQYHPVGSVVEFGCYEGTASIFIQRLLQQAPGAYEFHTYDSFAGLPVKTDEDRSPAGEQFGPGKLRADKSVFIRHFKQAGLPLPIIHKLWFSELRSSDIPDNIIFAFLDGDFYRSIRDSLVAIESKLSPHALILVDDYQSEALPGVRRAVHDWQKRHPEWRCRTEARLAILSR